MIPHVSLSFDSFILYMRCGVFTIMFIYKHTNIHAYIYITIYINIYIYLGYTGPNGQAATLCPVGTYKDVIGSAECTKCGENTYNTNTGSIAADACVVCPVHTVTDSLTGKSMITDCVADLGKYLCVYIYVCICVCIYIAIVNICLYHSIYHSYNIVCLFT